MEEMLEDKNFHRPHYTITYVVEVRKLFVTNCTTLYKWDIRPGHSPQEVHDGVGFPS
jgi:hypothetical protein